MTVRSSFSLLAASFSVAPLARARPETKVVNHPSVVAEIPFGPKTLTCQRSHDPRTYNFDFLDLNVPPLPGVPAFEKGLTLHRGVDLHFDPSCEGMDVAGAAQRLNGKLQVAIQYSTTIQWVGGFGQPCQKLVTHSVLFNLSPIIDEWVCYEKSRVEATAPSSYCN